MLIAVNHSMNSRVQKPFKHHLVCELEASVVTSVQSVTLALIEVKDEAFFPLTGDSLPAKHQLSQLSNQLKALVPDALSISAAWRFTTLHLAQCSVGGLCGDRGRGPSSLCNIRQ